MRRLAIASLRDLGARLGADLRAEIDRLNRSLYAPGRGDWNGAALASLCARLERERDAADGRPSALLPLNP